MKLPGRFLLLRILATSALGAFVYAGAVTLRSAVFGMDGGLFALLLFILIMLLGHLTGKLLLGEAPVLAIQAAGSSFTRFLTFMLHIKDGAKFTAAFSAWAVILLPLLASLLIYGKYGIWRIAFEMLLALVAYIMSLKHSKLTSTEIMSNTTIYAGFIVLAVCLEVPYFIKSLSYLRPLLFMTSYFFILAFLIIKNQEDIDSNIFDKKHVEKSILPKHLRRFNTFLVCLVFLLIILFFNLKTIVMYILQLAGKLTILIISVITWLMGHILPPMGTPQQGGAGAQNPNFFGDSIELIYPLKNLIFNTVKYFIILYLAYRILRYLTRKLPLLVSRLIKWIKKLLSIKKGERGLETTDYIDETETIKPVHDYQKMLKKKTGKRRRDLRSITDPVERVRHMYSSMLCMLPLVGIKPDKCDTTMEILSKSALSGEVTKELSPFTSIYNQVRYGDKVPDAGMLREAEGHFDKVVDVIVHK